MSYQIASDLPRLEEDLRRLRNQVVTWVVVCATVTAAAAAAVVVWRTNGSDAQMDARLVQVREQVGKLETQLTALQGAMAEQRRVDADDAAAPAVQQAARRAPR